jgi:uncharacterized protein (TIGR03435 family)
MKSSGLAGAGAVVLWGAIVAAQPIAQDAPSMAFEVASVKPNASGPGESYIRRQPGGGFQVRNMTLRDLVTFAYQVQGFQLVGGPDWIRDDRFDITAKAGRDLPPTGFGGTAPEMLMLRALLEERFRLAVHRETREMPIYALVLARPDGQPGPQLRRSQTDCAALMKAASAPGAAPPPQRDDGRPLCGLTGRSGLIMGGGYPISELPRFFSAQVQRVVVDKTGLTGAWDFDLKFTPQQVAAGVDAQVDGAASLFTALQEQLGLKLEPAEGPVDVLVIDRVQPPTPD